MDQITICNVRIVVHTHRELSPDPAVNPLVLLVHSLFFLVTWFSFTPFSCLPCFQNRVRVNIGLCNNHIKLMLILLHVCNNILCLQLVLLDPNRPKILINTALTMTTIIQQL